MNGLMLILASSLLGTAPALAQPCTGYTADAQQQSGLAYDPTEVTPQLVQVLIRTKDVDLDNSCQSQRIESRPLNNSGKITLRGSGATLRWEPFRSSDTASVAPAAITLTGNSRRQLLSDGQVLIDLFQVQAGQYVPPGDYIADVELAIGQRDARPFQITVRVVPALRLVSSAIQSLSLGEVSDGGEAESTFFYQSNALIRIIARSDNRGVLVHARGAAFGSIPYQATLSGQTLDLSADDVVTLSDRSTGIRADQLKVTVSPQQGRFAGTYTDVLTLEFNAY